MLPPSWNFWRTKSLSPRHSIRNLIFIRVWLASIAFPLRCIRVIKRTQSGIYIFASPRSRDEWYKQRTKPPAYSGSLTQAATQQVLLINCLAAMEMQKDKRQKIQEIPLNQRDKSKTIAEDWSREREDAAGMNNRQQQQCQRRWQVHSKTLTHSMLIVSSVLALHRELSRSTSRNSASRSQN